MNYKTYGRRGFTLIELLVVIAIIAILAAILFPVFAAARERGRQIVCTGNLSQLAKAFRMYADDHEGHMPRDIYWAMALAGFPAHIEQGNLWPYVKSRGVYLCPSDKGRHAARGVLSPGETFYPLSYSMNPVLSGGKVDRIRRPSTVFLLLHEMRSTIDDGVFWWPGDNLPERVHWGGTTLAYCDMHVKWQSTDEMAAAIDRGDWLGR